jgi:hypothetical protein
MRRCGLDPTISKSSLFRDFLSVQREEDCAAAKEAVQQFVNMQATITNEQTQAVRSVTSEDAQVPDVRSLVSLNSRLSGVFTMNFKFTLKTNLVGILIQHKQKKLSVKVYWR